MSKLNQVIVAGNPKNDNKAITEFTSENDDVYGRIRLDVVTLVSSDSGFGRFVRRSAFVTFEEKDLAMLAPMIKVGEPYPFEGKIVVEESLTPFYDNQEPKTKGADGDVVLHQGQPVYRNTYFTQNMDAQDVLLRTDREGETFNEEPATTESTEGSRHF